MSSTDTIHTLLSLSSSSSSSQSSGCRVTPRWPRSIACLQRLAGTDPVSLRSWSVPRARGWPGRRLQSPSPSERPDARLTWQCRSSCTGALWVSTAMLPKCWRFPATPAYLSHFIQEKPTNTNVWQILTVCSAYGGLLSVKPFSVGDPSVLNFLSYWRYAQLLSTIRCIQWLWTLGLFSDLQHVHYINEFCLIFGPFQL